MREEVALVDAAKGGIAVWGDERLDTRLSFIYRKERENDPAIEAISHVVRQAFDAAPGATADAGQVPLNSPERRNEDFPIAGAKA